MTEEEFPDRIMIGDAKHRAKMDPTAQTAAFADRLLDSQTPQQAAIARKIYDRLKSGAEVDDVKDLIDQLSATRRPPRAAPDRSRVLRLYEEE